MEDNDDQSTINSADGVGSLQTNPKKHVGSTWDSQLNMELRSSFERSFRNKSINLSWSTLRTA
jgi:hypothetical protein